ncbi:MAG: hypothetical protein PHO20_04555 [Candidatus Peribacteraceae bacterium]|nr:hypothetical protein [Candidatus Peribacteraceae bacterium]MDD5740011.1 hypothetical protein [Candidatus Peribacteraceae bacterium]
MTTQRIITIAGIILCSGAAILLAGLLFSVLHTSGFWLLPGFGLLGIVVFLQSFPLFPLSVIIVLAIALAFLLRRFAAFRRHALPCISFALLTLILLSGFFFSLTSVLNKWQPPPPPKDDHLAESFLRGYGAWRFHNVFQGTITDVGEHSYVMRSPNDRRVSVELMPGMRLPAGPQIGSGDTVLIIGEIRGEIIRAFGIRKL